MAGREWVDEKGVTHYPLRPPHRPQPPREFKTGASRDSDEGKLDYEGFFSPLVLIRYANYMHKHRHLPDGTLRASDNWQKGIPLEAYMKSLWRHLMSVWCWHRGFEPEETVEDALCGIIFNAMGYLHELKKKKGEGNG